MSFDSRGSGVLQNGPVEIVDINDADNRTTTVYFHQITKLPIRQIFYRRNAVTKEKDEEITLYSKYRDVGGGVQWPFAIERVRNQEKIFEIFSESVTINKSAPESLFALPSGITLLKPEGRQTPPAPPPSLGRRSRAAPDWHCGLPACPCAAPPTGGRSRVPVPSRPRCGCDPNPPDRTGPRFAAAPLPRRPAPRRAPKPPPIPPSS